MICILNFKPEDEVSIGVHEKIGPCDEYTDIQTAFGMVCYASLPISNSMLSIPVVPRRFKSGNTCAAQIMTSNTSTFTAFPVANILRKAQNGTPSVGRPSPTTSSTLR